jgi:hypothetical protein
MKLFFKAVLILGISYIFTAQAIPVAEIGHVDLMQGEVIIHSLSGLARQIGNGTQIYEGETIETTDGAVVINLIDGSVLEFYDYSKFTFQKYRNNGLQAQYELHQGAVKYTSNQHVTKTKIRDIKFKAGTSLVSPIGTGFYLTKGNVAGVSIAVVFVNYGSVNLKSKNKNVIVNPGEWGIGLVRMVKGQRRGQINVGRDMDIIIDQFIKDTANSNEQRAELETGVRQLISNFFNLPRNSSTTNRISQDDDEFTLVPSNGGGGSNTEEPASPSRQP